MLKNIIFSSILLVPAALLTSCSDKVDGRWRGSCQNTTYGANASLEVSLIKTGSSIRGTLMLGGDELVGSGPLSGSVSGNSISFTTPGDNQAFTSILWSGHVSGDSISGTYRVEPTAAAAAMGIPVQVGTFLLNKE